MEWRGLVPGKKEKDFKKRRGSFFPFFFAILDIGAEEISGWFIFTGCFPGVPHENQWWRCGCGCRCCILREQKFPDAKNTLLLFYSILLLFDIWSSKVRSYTQKKDKRKKKEGKKEKKNPPRCPPPPRQNDVLNPRLKLYLQKIHDWNCNTPLLYLKLYKRKNLHQIARYVWKQADNW